jgi:4-hydroxybenzoate polyprenyltransferase
LLSAFLVRNFRRPLVSLKNINQTLVNKLIGFLRLTRPANLVTAISDILAGVTIATALSPAPVDYNSVIYLVIATLGLYGGGVVFNDVFDADLDAVERPERPIPSGLIPVREAALFGFLLLAAGIISAGFASVNPSGAIALMIAVAALVYDKWSKHHSIIGPLNMGICRGLNLLLGMSISAAIVAQYWYIGTVPIIYIAAITMISRGEVHGGKSITTMGALGLYVIVIGCILYAAIRFENILYTLFFLAAFGFMTIPPLIKAMGNPIGPNIGKAVKAGVLGLILMNASWAAAFGATFSALILLLLLPVSIILAKLFAVT